MSEAIEISGDIETPLISDKSPNMASWSNISVPGNVGAILQQQVMTHMMIHTDDVIDFREKKFELGPNLRIKNHSRLRRQFKNGAKDKSEMLIIIKLIILLVFLFLCFIAF